MSKTPEELAEEFVSKNTTGSETYEHGLRNGYLAGYQARDKEIEQLEIQIVNLKAEIKEEWRKEAADCKEEIAMLKAELREIGNE